MSQYSSAFNHNEGYAFPSNQISDLLQIFKTIHDVKSRNHSTIDIALRRFHSSYTKSSLDKFLDYIISLESILAHENDPKDSITYKSSAGCSSNQENGLTANKKVIDHTDFG